MEREICFIKAKNNDPIICLFFCKITFDVTNVTCRFRGVDNDHRRFQITQNRPRIKKNISTLGYFPVAICSYLVTPSRIYILKSLQV